MRSNSLRNTVVSSVRYPLRVNTSTSCPVIQACQKSYQYCQKVYSMPQANLGPPITGSHDSHVRGGATNKYLSFRQPALAEQPLLPRFGYLKSKFPAPDSSVYHLLDSGRGTRLSLGWCLRCRSTQSKTESRVSSVLPLRT